MVLTGAGREVMAHVEAVLEAESQLRAVAASAGGGGDRLTGRVVLSAGESLVSARLPAVIAALRRTHPGIEVDLRTMGTAAAVAALRTGELDLALLLEDEAAFRDIECTPLAREPLVLVCAPGHRAAGKAAAHRWTGRNWPARTTSCTSRAVRTVTASSSGCSRPPRTAAPDHEVRQPGGCQVLRRRWSRPQPAGTRQRRGRARGGQPGTGSRARFPDVTVQLARRRRRWVSPRRP
ncbi:LysR substrate-binding domain-containing protein [Streptomyces zhihengii]